MQNSRVLKTLKELSQSKLTLLSHWVEAHSGQSQLLRLGAQPLSFIWSL